MPDFEPLSQRELDVAELLLQGESNKQIALALGITEHTVEFHLKNIYRKLRVPSRTKAIPILRILLEQIAREKLGESVVVPGEETKDNRSEPTAHKPVAEGSAQALQLQGFARFLRKASIWIAVGVLLVVGVVTMLNLLSNQEFYRRECEYPDAATVGQPIYRSNASNQEVHGQFGATPEDPWPAQAGEVIYQYIRLPELDHVFLKIRYSKDSPATTPILVYLDEEPTPRASILPADLSEWNQFAWTGPVDLGRIESGLHSIKLSTRGEQYGVADLDQLVLTAKP